MTVTQRPTDFAAILRGMPQPYLILKADLTIVGASDSYLRLTERTLDDIVGRHILEAFPENPDAVAVLRRKSGNPLVSSANPIPSVKYYPL